MKNNNSFVISIAAVSGGGKTTIAEHLHEKLKQSKVLYFDDYQFLGPEDIIDWVDRGANYDEWDLHPLIQDIERLRNDNTSYIILDFPFARQHLGISKYIDITVFVDTPLDIALVRRITRDFQNSNSWEILNNMDFYVNEGRKGYLEMLKSIKPTSDLVVNGALSISEVIEKIYETINKKKIKSRGK